MVRVLLIAACVVLLNGCPFLPPNPYKRSIYGQYRQVTSPYRQGRAWKGRLQRSCLDPPT